MKKGRAIRARPCTQQNVREDYLLERRDWYRIGDYSQRANVVVSFRRNLQVQDTTGAVQFIGQQFLVGHRLSVDAHDHVTGHESG